MGPRTIMMALGALLMLGLVGAMVFSECSKRSDRRAQFLARCRVEHERPKRCEALVDENGEECYRVGVNPGGRGTPEGFGFDKYYSCLILGPEEWTRRRAIEVRKKQEQRRREQGELTY
jgi:hypothetical protein